MARPVLRYHGGKWLKALWIIAQIPEHRVYVEPFAGAASVLLRKPRSHAEVYNDLDGEVVNLFRVLRSPETAQLLIAALALTPYARAEFGASYEPCADQIEQARRTVVRSHMGFGSASACGAKTGFRKTSNRSGTTPAHDWANYPKTLDATIERLRGVVIENALAASVMIYNDTPATLHYVDPPYVLSTRRQRNAYCKKGYRFEMTDDDHRELAETLKGLKGMVMLSGYRSALYEELYSEWQREEVQTLADGARPRTECLWFNPAAWERRPQRQMFSARD